MHLPNQPQPHAAGRNKGGTPARRRQAPRNACAPAVQKIYASENDMPAVASIPIEIEPRRAPLTPQKSAANSPANPPPTTSTKSKLRSGVKSRPKTGSTSPIPPKHGRTTPPYSAAAKSHTAAAFAGATFHASPAPSSLPIPSFLSKAMDSPASKDSSRDSQEPSPPATDSETPTPRHIYDAFRAESPTPRHVSDPPTTESPLDFFFRADRAEKERARRASSANALASMPSMNGPFSPPSQNQAPQEPRTDPKKRNFYPEQRALFQRSASGTSTAESDLGRPIDPAFSQPSYHERNGVARAADKQTTLYPSPLQQTTVNTDRGAELKNFLMMNAQSPSKVPPSSRLPTNGTVPQPMRSTVTEFQQFSMTSSTTVVAAETDRSHDLLRLENTLRQALNLGPATAAANFQSS